MQKKKYATAEDICDIVIKETGADIYRRIRKRDVVIYRQLTQYLIHQCVDIDLKSIGWLFKNNKKPMDHTTIVYAKKVIMNLLQTEEWLLELYNKLYAEIESKYLIYNKPTLCKFYLMKVKKIKRPEPAKKVELKKDRVLIEDVKKPFIRPKAEYSNLRLYDNI